MKIARILLLFVVALSLLCVSVLSHSGGTDSKGGHRNSATGEYHYHHGHSAHQHTDLDGDGVKDCPYNFENKTGKTSGSKSPSSNTSGSKSSSSSKSQTQQSFINPNFNSKTPTVTNAPTTTADSSSPSTQSTRSSGLSNEEQATAIVCTCAAAFFGACYLANKNR